MKISFRNIAFILAILAIAYFPIWSFIFSLKNDFFTQYFLQRFFIGQTISGHQFPLWNPYFNYGLPVYNDMNGGFWYPLTWLNGLLTGYNAYSFTIEEILHFPIAALGIYALGKYYGWQKTTGIIAAISYGCCGYFIAHTQHYNWITGAAWLPWCLLTMYKCMDNRSIKNLSAGAIVFSLFISGSHPGLIIGGLYFFVFMSAIHLGESKNWKTNLVNLLFLVALVSFTVGGLIFSYAEILPLFTRSGKIAGELIAANATPPGSFLSFFLPLPYTQVANEITMNNHYSGLLVMVSIFAGIFVNRKRSYLFLFAIAVFFFFLSTDFSISVFLINKLPLLSYIRLSGELRIFGIVAIIIFGAHHLDQLVVHNKIILRNVALILSASLASLALIIFISNYASINVSRIFQAMLNASDREQLKQAIHHIGFREALVIQAFLQSILLLLMALATMKKPQLLIWLVGVDMIMATLLNLPFTGVSMRPVSEIQAQLNKSPDGFPVPFTFSEKNIYSVYPTTDLTIGNWSFYSKQIAIDQWHPYPILLKTTHEYFERSHKNLIDLGKGFLFTENDSSKFQLQQFSPDKFQVSVDAIDDDRLIIKQNLYPGWKTTVNNSVIIPDTAYYSFPSIPIKKGHNEISYEFRKPLVTFLFILYWAVLLLLVIALVATTMHNRRSK